MTGDYQKKPYIYEKKAVLFISLFIYAAANSIFALSVSMLAKYIINSIENAEQITSGMTFILYLTLCLCCLILIFLGKYTLFGAGLKTIGNIQINIFSKINHLDLSKSSHLGKGNIITYITKDVQAVSSFLQSGIIDFFECFFMLIVMSAASIWMDIKIFLFTIFCAFTYGITIFFVNRIRKYDEEIRDQQEELVALSLQIYKGLPILHFFTGLRRINENYQARLSASTESEIKRAKLAGLYSILALSSNTLREMGIIVICPLFLGFDLGSTMAMINISSYLSTTLAGLGESILQYQKVRIAESNIKEALELPIETLNSPWEEDFQKVEFKNVSFAYKDKKVLNNINCVITSGEFIGIVGEIGSGKSTFFKLLTGLYCPLDGEIYLNNKLVTNKDIASLRQYAAYVDQESRLLEGTLRDNLTCFNPNIGDDHIWGILDKLRLSEWASELDQGLDTPMGQAGLQVSGGERQRINIARALLKNSPILIMDEPTANLDAENELLARKVIYGEKGKKTIIIISHRMESLTDAERIIQVKDGALIKDTIITV